MSLSHVLPFHSCLFFFIKVSEKKSVLIIWLYSLTNKTLWKSHLCWFLEKKLYFHIIKSENLHLLLLLRDAHRRLRNNGDYLNKPYNDQKNPKCHLKRAWKSRFYLFSILIFKQWRWLYKYIRIPFVNDDIFRVSSGILRSYCLLKFRKKMYQPDQSNFLVYHSKLQVINLSTKQSKQLIFWIFSVLIGLSVYNTFLARWGYRWDFDMLFEVNIFSNLA